jgi:DNA-binding IclR family transcriptional regulator
VKTSERLLAAFAPKKAWLSASELRAASGLDRAALRLLLLGMVREGRVEVRVGVGVQYRARKKDTARGVAWESCREAWEMAARGEGWEKC